MAEPIYIKSFYEEILSCFSLVNNEICQMQIDFGYPAGNMNTVESRYNFSLNIKDEVDELKEAIEEGNIVEIRDAICDILVFALGLLHHSGDKLCFGRKLQDWIETSAKTEINLAMLDETVKNIEIDSLSIIESSKRNKQGVSNIVANLCYWCYLISDIYNFDIQYDIEAVIKSNRTKFCKDQDTLERTLQKYQDLEVEVYSRGEFPNMLVVSSADQVDKNGKQYRQDKFLKSVDFKEPIFDEPI